jgi:phosphoenolpyruvate carboxykinase (ATP)
MSSGPYMKTDALLSSLLAKAKRNVSDAELIELALTQGGARLTAAGALAVETGVHTGRSVQDKFIVRDAATDPVICGTTTSP